MGRRQVPTRPDYIKWLLLLGAAALVVLLGGYAWRYLMPHSVNVDRYRYPIAGIDVSKHNGDIDYQQVRDDDYQFVFIKASEGMTYKDDAFERNYQGARKAGLKVGAYHFFRKNRTGQEQAENLLMIEILTGKGYQVMIYTNLDGYNKYYKDMLGDHDLWLCSFTRPDLLTSLPHCIQQFSHEGKVKGAKGKVDLNVYRGSRSDWEQYLASVKKPNS